MRIRGGVYASLTRNMMASGVFRPNIFDTAGFPWTYTNDMRGVLGRGESLCFRTQGAMFCRCPIKAGTFSVLGLDLYPQMGIIGSPSLGLVDIKHVPWGACFWREVLREPYGVREMTIVKAPTIPMGWGFYIHIFFTGMAHDGSPLPCSWVCRGFGCRTHKSLLAHLWIIQRAVLKFVRARIESRKLAVMMGEHARLGTESPLSVVPEDILRHRILPLCRNLK